MRIVLSTGPVRAQQDGAIVIDHRNRCFWRYGERRGGSRRSDSGVSFRLIAALLIWSPDLVPWNRLIAHLWEEDPEGGPLFARNNISIALSRSREILDWLGVERVTAYDLGTGLREPGQHVRGFYRHRPLKGTLP